MVTTIAKTVEEEVLSASVCEQTEGRTDTNVRSGGGGTRAAFHHTVAVAQTIGELEAGGGGVVTGDSTKQ